MGSKSRQVLILLAAAFALALACKPKHPFVWANDVPPTEVPVENVPLRPGDQITVQVPRSEELRSLEPLTVNADGTIVLPLVGVLKVEGLTAQAAAKKLNARLGGIIVNPQGRISVVNPRSPLVAVVGEVRTPSSYPLRHGDGLLVALALAGGLTEFASPDSIYVVRKYPKQQRYRFRYSDLVGGVERSVKFQLRDGDVIVVE